MSTEKLVPEKTTCPACDRIAVKQKIRMHCESPTCTWQRCPFHDCGSIFSMTGNHYKPPPAEKGS